MAAIFDTSDSSSPSAYSASQTALLLLDFQHFTVKQVSSKEAAISNASKILEWARSNNILIIHNIIDPHGGIPVATKNSARLRDYLDSLIAEPTSTEIPFALRPSNSPNELITFKQPGVVSALAMPDVQALLEKNKIRSLVLCGLSTSGALMRTATPATDSGYVVSVIEDACADKTEEVHEVVMKQILPNRCHVVTAEGWVGEWEKRDRKE